MPTIYCFFFSFPSSISDFCPSWCPRLTPTLSTLQSTGVRRSDGLGVRDCEPQVNEILFHLSACVFGENRRRARRPAAGMKTYDRVLNQMYVCTALTSSFEGNSELWICRNDRLDPHNNGDILPGDIRNHRDWQGTCTILVKCSRAPRRIHRALSEVVRCSPNVSDMFTNEASGKKSSCFILGEG